MKLLKTIIVVLLISVFAGCKNDDIAPGSEMKIEFGLMCGWCTGEELITVTSSQISYQRNIPCGDDKGTIKKEGTISPSEWNEIISSFSISEFKTLEYNTCNICVDGCDEMIKITENEMTHEIRYSPSEKIQETENLKLILSSLMNKMKERN